MDQEEKERLERRAEEELNRQFGDGTVQKVEVLQYGDEPVIEPGQVIVRVILTPTDEDPDETLHAFEKAHRAAIEDLRKKVARKMRVRADLIWKVRLVTFSVSLTTPPIPMQMW